MVEQLHARGKRGASGGVGAGSAALDDGVVAADNGGVEGLVEKDAALGGESAIAPGGEFQGGGVVPEGVEPGKGVRTDGTSGGDGDGQEGYVNVRPVSIGIASE